MAGLLAAIFGMLLGYIVAADTLLNRLVATFLVGVGGLIALLGVAVLPKLAGYWIGPGANVIQSHSESRPDFRRGVVLAFVVGGVLVSLALVEFAQNVVSYLNAAPR